MSSRVQVILDEAEREAFRAQAAREGLSLSAWLREAGRARLAAQRPKRITSVEDFRALLESLGDREDEGPEPDWEEHKKVISEGYLSGAAPT